MATSTLTYAELSTILAALRLWQDQDEVERAQESDYFLDCKDLNDSEIDSLCERLNCGEIVRIEGGPK